MHLSLPFRSAFSLSISSNCVRALLALTVLGLAAPASAATMYAFRFGGAAAGHFITDGIGVDPGYELITSMTFDFVTTRDDGARHEGPFSTTDFNDGAGYNPVTHRFINHYAGGTYDDLGLTFLTGVNGRIIIQGISFPHGLEGHLIPDVLAYGSLVVSPGVPVDPAPIPEPATLILFGTGLLGTTFAHRRRRRAA